MSGSTSLAKALNLASGLPTFLAAPTRPWHPLPAGPTCCALLAAHGLDAAPHPQEDLPLPDLQGTPVEDLAVAAAGGGPAPRVLVDCRSYPVADCPAPTYRLALALELEAVVPLAVTGPFGAEPAAGLLLLGDLLAKGESALLVVSQALPPGVSRHQDGQLAVDGVAALRLMRGPGARRVRGVALGQGDVAETLGAALEVAKRRPEDLSWAALAGDLSTAARALPPKTQVLIQRQAPALSFGAVDALAAWTQAGERGETGVLVFVGRHGAVGAVVVSEAGE